MTGETSGPSAQDIRMASFEEKFNDLLNFVRLLVKRDTESEKQVEKTMRSTKMVDASALLALAKPDVENEARTVDPNVAPENDPPPKGNWNTFEGPQSLQMAVKESEKEAQSPISKKEEPKEVDHPMIPHKRHTPKNVVERVEQLEKQLDEVASTKSLSKGKQKRHRRQGTLMLHTGRYQSSRNLSSSAKLKSEPRKFCTLPMPMDELYPRLLEKRLISPVFLKQSPHLLHDSSKKCEFHFGRPGHSLEDCHALKNKVQDLVDHGILRINEGSTPSVIIAWPPERRKDETVIPSPQSQGPTTCGIQPVHLTTLPTLSEVGEHTVPKTQPKLMSNFRNLDDQCSSDKEKAEYRTSRCVTLKRKIQELGHSELEVPAMVPS
uniref:Retrotransposon gag domain-containing protein n=1 Tax=Fagus sylvatica TaxID=28930 RepID=A0A2N9ES84_FAGSY